MMYLIDLGFEEEIIKDLVDTIPNAAIEKLTENHETVTNNIKYLMELGVTNYKESFVKFYNMFLLDNEQFEEIFSKYDRDDLIAKLEKNIAIMEYL